MCNFVCPSAIFQINTAIFQPYVSPLPFSLWGRSLLSQWSCEIAIPEYDFFLGDTEKHLADFLGYKGPLFEWISDQLRETVNIKHLYQLIQAQLQEDDLEPCFGTWNTPIFCISKILVNGSFYITSM